MRVRFKTERANQIAEERGLQLIRDQAQFFGVTPSSYSRVINGVVNPGEDFIASVLASHPGDADITWDALFEVVEA